MIYISSFDQCKVVYFRVTFYVVDDWVQTVLNQIFSCFPIIWVWSLLVHVACLTSFLTYNGNSCLLVVAEKCQAGRHAYNGILFDKIPFCAVVCSILKELCPVFISNSRSSKGCDVYIWENTGMIDIDKRYDS